MSPVVDKTKPTAAAAKAAAKVTAAVDHPLKNRKCPNSEYSIMYLNFTGTRVPVFSVNNVNKWYTGYK